MKNFFLILSLTLLSSGSIFALPNLQDFKFSEKTGSFFNKAAGGMALLTSTAIFLNNSAIVSNNLGMSQIPEKFLDNPDFLKIASVVSAGLGLKSLMLKENFKHNLPYAGIAIAPFLLLNIENLTSSSIVSNFCSPKTQIAIGLLTASCADYINDSKIQSKLNRYPEERPGQGSFLLTEIIAAAAIDVTILGVLYKKVSEVLFVT